MKSLDSVSQAWKHQELLREMYKYNDSNKILKWSVKW